MGVRVRMAGMRSLLMLAAMLMAGAMAGRVFAGEAPAAGGEATLPTGFDPQKHMRVSEVRQGMKGYGLSVFRGTKIERFEVEVVSVLKNFNPQHDVILISCKGANLEHTGAVAGMSGSPIYLMDEQGRARMVGAFAYGWPLMKDPMAGVQPIEYMLRLPLESRETDGAGASKSVAGKRKGGERIRWTIDESMQVPWSRQSQQWNPFIQAGIQAARARQMAGEGGAEMRLRPLATPMMTSGVPRSVLDAMEPVLRAHGIVPLEAGGAAAFGGKDEPPAKLEPGSSIAVPMLTGDVDMTAIGTTTEVIGDRVLGFGHPFFSEGDVSLPMSSGYVHSVIANIMNSFKLGSGTQVRGTLHADQLVGIAGKVGPAPQTVPMEIRVVYEDGTLDRTYRFNAAQHSRFTPILATMAAMTAMTGQRELPQHHTLEMNFDLEFGNGQKLNLKNRTANANPMELFMMIGSPVQAGVENPFEKVQLRKLTGRIEVSREARQATVLSVSVPRTKYQPGETVKAFVRYRPFRGAEAILPIEFALPRDLVEGQYDFAVLDWQNHLMEEQQLRPFRFTAESAEEMFAVIRDYMGVRRDALYVRLLSQPDGVAIGRTAMPKLPSSMRRVMLGAGRSNTTQFVSSAGKTVATKYIMEGQAHFQITVDKSANVEGPKGKVEQPGPGVPPRVGEPKPVNPGPNPAPKPGEPKPNEPKPPGDPNKPVDNEPGE